jgi:hypothetical protein
MPCQNNFADLLSGKRFTPDSSGSLLFPRSASDYGLEAHMFYRQSSLFVRFLHDQNPIAFRRMFNAVEKNTEFAEAVRSSYGKPLDGLWQAFLIKAKFNFPLQGNASAPPELVRSSGPTTLAAEFQR